MRIQRIELKDFRGVRSADISLAPTGVTIIEGENEVGKSSLAEALHLLFDELDSSSKAGIKALKPVAADAGPWVRVELSTGPYELVYEKRWLKERVTALRVTAPAHENRTGREAHERMQEILRETLDVDLFKALRYEQGKGIAQAAIAGSPSLLKALDATAGGSAAADDDGGLLARVEAERLRWFTPTGSPTQQRKTDAARLASLQEERSRTEEKLRALDTAADRHRTIGTDLARLAAEEPGRVQRVEELRQDAERIARLEQEVARHELAVQAAEGRLREAAAATAERAKLVERLVEANERLAELRRHAAQDEPGLAHADRERTEAAATYEEARRLRERCEQESALAAADAAHFDDAFQTELLEERHMRAQRADDAIREATKAIDGNPVTEERLLEVQAAAMALEVARARAGESGASVTVEALAPIDVRLGDHQERLEAGATLRREVSGDTLLTIGDVARITVAGPTAAKALIDAADEAGEQVARLLADASVDPSLPNAVDRVRELARSRREAESALEIASEALKDSLRDLTLASLADKVERGLVRRDAYRASRSAEPPLPTDGDAAREAAERCLSAAAEARRAEQVARATLDGAEERARSAREALNLRQAEIDRGLHDAAAAAAELAAARSTADDDALGEGLARAKAHADEVSVARAAAVAELEQADPETTAALRANAQDALERLRRDRDELTIEQAGIRSALAVQGQDGLADRLAEVETRIAGLEQQVTLESRRAAAVELLHGRLMHHRAEALRSYVAPYRERLESFARLVFGPSASVAVDEATLQITARTLDGETVPYESLSGGAKEQLCVVARLACAALVAKPGADGVETGVPVVFDDALGYSDPRRLERLGAAFRRAGETCQVVVLTCVPDRYAHVGSAKVVRLGRGTGAD